MKRIVLSSLIVVLVLFVGYTAATDNTMYEQKTFVVADFTSGTELHKDADCESRCTQQASTCRAGCREIKNEAAMKKCFRDCKKGGDACRDRCK